MMIKNVGIAKSINKPISLRRYDTGSFCLQQGVIPLILNHPIIGTFSYHLSGLPQEQCERPIMLSPRLLRSKTTPKNEAIDAPSIPPSIVIKIV